MLNDSNAVPTIAVRDIEEARAFYEDVLGLTVQDEMPKAGLVVYRSGNGVIQVYQTENAGSNQATYLSWEVNDIESIVASLKEKGVEFEHYPDMPEARLEGDVHVWEGDEDEKGAWFKDPDGNILCMHERG